MKKLLLMSTLALSLAACTSPTPAPRLQAITLDVPAGALRVGEDVQASVRTLDAQGQPLPAAVTFTSSAPHLVSVDERGQLRALRLTPNGTDVTITARSGALADSVSVTTYGLELTVGTYHEDAAGTTKVGTAAFTRFRGAPNSPDLAPANVTVRAPDGQVVLDRQLFASVSNAAAVAPLASPSLTQDARVAPQAGTYLASVTLGGVTYEASDVLDPTRVAAFPQNVTLTVNGRTYRLNATLTDNPVLAGVLFKNDGFRRLFGFSTASGLPRDAALPQVDAGVYGTGVYSLPLNPLLFTVPTPEDYSVTYTATGPVTLN